MDENETQHGGKRAGSGRKAKGIEPRTELLSGRVSKTVKKELAKHGRPDGLAVENLVRQLTGPENPGQKVSE